jgi:hypothetical protein
MSRSRFMIISLVLFVVGLFVILGSVGWGHEAANAYLRAQGGSMDAAQFAIILQEHINIYRWIGGIMSIISGLAFVKAIELR